MNELEAIKAREARWTFCLALSKWRELGASTASLRQISDAMKYGFSDHEVRELVRYLEGIGLCKTEALPNGELWAIRTPALVDIVEYNASAPNSIARPDKKWW